MRRRITFMAAVVLCFVLFPAAAQANQMIQLSNGAFKYSSPTGKTIQDQVTVSSVGSDSIPRVLVYVADVTYDAKGNPSYVVPNRTSQPDKNSSPASWVQLYLADSTKTYQNTPYIELGDRGSAVVKYDINIPANTPPGDYTAIVFFEMDNSQVKSTGASAVNARAGVRLNIRVEGAILQKIKVKYDKVSKFVFDNNLIVSIDFANEGNIDTKMKNKLQLKQGNTVIEDFDMKNLAEFSFPADTPSLLFGGGYNMDSKTLIGKYELVLTTSYYDEQLQRDVNNETMATVWFTPWWLILAIVLIPVILIMVLVRRKRPKKPKKEKKAKEPKESKVSPPAVDEPKGEESGMLVGLAAIAPAAKFKPNVEEDVEKNVAENVEEKAEAVPESTSENTSPEEYKDALRAYEADRKSGATRRHRKK